MELTVGYAAGLIALGTFLGRQFFPNALVYILSGILGNADSAATWTLSAPVFHQSFWPWLLRTDSAYSHGTRPAVQWISRLVPILSLLFAVTSIVTPLGLYEGLREGKPVSAKFVYAKDPSVFGYATLSREGYNFSRYCGAWTFGEAKPCPFTNGTLITETFPNSTISMTWTGDGPTLNTTIPSILQQIYKSGTRSGSSIANYFDIQWRQFAQSSRNFNNASVDTNLTVGVYRNVQSVLLNNEIQAVEGLIVDTQVGRIGFRNHTVPLGLAHGASWSEDILFLEPETVCVDTNLTLDYSHDSSNVVYPDSDFHITDHGGFVNLPSVLNNDTAVPDWPNNTQETLDLHARAYWAALMFNFRTALYFNITNPERDGKKAFMYMNSKENDSFLLDARKEDSTFSGVDGYFMDQKFAALFGDFGGYTNRDRPGHSSNKWNMTTESFTNITKFCQGVDATTAAWSGLVNVACGLMRSPPFRNTPGEIFRYDAGTKWSQKLFTCASAAKVSIKSVDFTFNGTTPTLKDLHVTKIQNNNYTDNSSMPIWGVEDYGLRWANNELRQMWGLVSPYYEGKMNVSTYRKPEFYLPGYMPVVISDGIGPSFMNMPGGDLSEVGLSAAYCTPSSGGVSTGCLGRDYSGTLDIGIFQKWSNFSSKAETAAKIPNLIFTDIMAAAVVGTVGLGPGEDSRVAQVVPNRLKVRYHMAFAVPAFVCAVVLMLLVLAVAGSWFTKRTTFHQIRLHIQRLSPGRIFTSLLAMPEHRSTLGMSGKSWSEKYGPELVDLTEHDETADVGDHPNGQPGKEKGSYVGINVAEK